MSLLALRKSFRHPVQMVVFPTPAARCGAGFSVVVKFACAQEVLPAPGADGGVSTLAGMQMVYWAFDGGY